METSVEIGERTQNDLLMRALLDFYAKRENLEKLRRIVSGEANLSLRIVDWFVTNYSKKYYTVYPIPAADGNYQVAGEGDAPPQSYTRFKVYNDYKLKLRAYSKKNFDPFNRCARVKIPYDEGEDLVTTVGQLNFFKWAITNHILDYIEENYKEIELDMNQRNTTSKKKKQAAGEAVADAPADSRPSAGAAKTRKKRQELSVSACKSMKKEKVEIVIKFT